MCVLIGFLHKICCHQYCKKILQRCHLHPDVLEHSMVQVLSDWHLLLDFEVLPLLIMENLTHMSQLFISHLQERLSSPSGFIFSWNNFFLFGQIQHFGSNLFLHYIIFCYKFWPVLIHKGTCYFDIVCYVRNLTTRQNTVSIYPEF